MNREEIIRKLKEYNLDVERYIIISGSAMVLYGIKDETPDIDISVTEDYEEELLENNIALIEHVSSDGTLSYIINDELNFGQNYYSTNKVFIEGLPVQSIEDIIKLKEFLNRDKDKKDLELIKRYLNR